MAKKAFNPDGLPVPRGSYSLVNVAQPGRMVFIAGQTASDHDGKVVGVGDAKAQTRFILGKIQRAVEAAGGTINDVVALNVFTTDVRNHRDINETRREVLGHVLRETLWLATAGIVAGMVTAVAAARLVSAFLYGLGPTDSGTFASAAMVLFVTSAVAGFLPARRAASVSPAQASKNE